MKKTFFIILTLSFFLQGFSQSEKGNDYKELKGRVEAVEKSHKDLLKVNDSLIKILNNNKQEILKFSEHFESSDSIQLETIRRIDDKNLQETISNANDVIGFQSTFINIFEVLFGAIAVLAGFVYFFSIRPTIQDARETSNQANQAIRDANDANMNANSAIIDANAAINELKDEIRQFDQKIENQVDSKFLKSFEDYKQLIIINDIERILRDIIGFNADAKKHAIYNLNTYSPNDFSQDQIFELLNILNEQYLSNETEEAIIYFLTKENLNES